ncbi:bifunctional oligoribonuclease/PAP phosphatase NrnA [Flagellimonas halotolerans]|uniref:Bifunctional oligoribonuclease/PAP phosphatase NrnA n=1 Tax=Flagellimonas halotolerans TaxID=3112164 RepID=A0ABU6IQW0_9FLAO|nr:MULTISPECIES: bifunctional oligoribonuclease/PAP phosphatase NrnA [unclassified Allomuricauda]MEC3965538.1 bifunctional oligoribonuclease/PAP phosphatase NrnA [Muricauda sp. SYSU M86414]MEC4265404.1 bifunctional oligoribonuclease/PAP phosphatase NrnA [Muricauda sp. SYSU M84420]
MNSADITTVKSILSQPQKIVIVPHRNPDGDAMGSCLALYAFLKEKGQTVHVVAPNDYPKFLKWLPGNDTVINFEKENSQAKERIDQATVIFTLDFNDLSRVGQMETVLQEANADFIMIDHHQQPSDYAKVTYSDVTMSSTCEMVYNFIDFLGETSLIDADIATNLYTGIMTDTGSFKYRSTSSKTHRVVAELIDKGADNMEIHQKVFDTNSPSRLHLLGIALSNMVILPEYRTAYITLSQDELDQYDFKKGDTEGFVNYGLTLEGIIFALIFIENREEGIIKISLRSVGDFSVNEFARAHFNGGGHTNAAGGRSEVSMEETISKFNEILKTYKSKLNP